MRLGRLGLLFLFPFWVACASPLQGVAEQRNEVGVVTDTLLEQRIRTFIQDAIQRRAFPAATVVVGRGNNVLASGAYGTYTYDADARRVELNASFDLASLTKVIATTTAVMLLVEEERLRLEEPIVTFFPNLRGTPKADITVRDLLIHASGLRPFVPFHTRGILTAEGIMSFIFNDSLLYRRGAEMRYSDFNFILLGKIIEHVSGQSLGAFTQSRIFEPLGMTATGFRSATGVSDPAVVPSEIDTLFRRRLVQGEVHDETAYILGGTAGHAGLFSNAPDLARFARMISQGGVLDGERFLREETLNRFIRRDGSVPNSTRALGWDTRSDSGFSSAGTRMGPRAFGHTGFTGTSIWVDPDSGIFVILLTNRVYPTRENRAIGQVRSDLADLVVQHLR